jgi:hypothetical protein
MYTPRLLHPALALATLCAPVLIAAPPAAPTGLRAWPLSDSVIALHWSAQADAGQSYEVQRRADWQDAWQDVGTDLPAHPTTFTDTGLQPDHAWQYRVLARNTDGASASQPAQAHTDSGPFGLRSIRFQNGMGGYTGAYDIGILQTQPNIRNTGAYVWVDNNSASDDNQALVNFTGIFGAEPYSVPQAATVRRATLRIYLGTNTNAQAYKPITVHQMLVPWNLNSSWSSPVWGGNGVDIDDIDAHSQHDDVFFPATPGIYYDIDVTPTVQAWIAGAGQHGWLIRTAWSDGYSYYTTHNSNVAHRPELIVRYDLDAANHFPQLAELHAPLPAATGVTEPAVLDIAVADPDGDSLSVVLHGRPAPLSEHPDFSVILLPDTQFYAAEMHGATRQIFFNQTDWIVANRLALNIPFVLHLGDIVQTGDIKSGQPNSLEWLIAAQAMYRLHHPVATGLPEGIPYAVCVGNHDQEPIWRSSGTTTFFNQYFGVSHFSKYSYYGGHFGDNNDNHYSLFSAGPYPFIVISLEYHDPARDTLDPGLLEWADALLKAHPGHRGIIISHHMVNPGYPATWSPYGEALYEVLKDNPNLHLMLGGHVTGEGLRVETYQGNTVYALVQDYQGYPDGGNGYLRIMTFSPVRNEISFQTYSPWIDAFLYEFNGFFSLPYDLGTPVEPFAELARYEGVAAGTRLQHPWDGLDADRGYEWFVELSDGRKAVRSDTYAFHTGPRTYTAWRRAWFADDDPDGDRLADPDGDGYSNLIEYACAGDPTSAASLFLPLQVIARDAAHAHLAYTRVRGTGLLWRHEVSGDLINWTDAASAPASVTSQITDNNDGTETVDLSIDNPTATHFLRVRAELP